MKKDFSSPSVVAYARFPMYRRRPSAAAAMTASFSAALIGSPPVAVLAPSAAMVVLAMPSVMVSTADMVMRRA